jgi:hypothetical protein
MHMIWHKAIKKLGKRLMQIGEWELNISLLNLKLVLEGEGVTQFGKVGDTFDPHLYESMEQVESRK